ncbi:MAG: ribosome silencing factor [Gammaproteobacteria bacterium]|nr:ribosome silencing factor [Gammaproteobacteria bacterium]
MQTEKLKDIVVDALEDLKATDIKVIDVRDKSTITDIMIVATGTSNRQVKGLADHVSVKAKEHGFPRLSIEGEDTGEWVLVDLGDVVVHVMQARIREFYQLERLWEMPIVDTSDVEDEVDGSRSGE